MYKMNSCRYIERLQCPKTSVFRWHRIFQDGFIDLKYGSYPGQPKSAVTNANIAAVAGLVNYEYYSC